MSLFDEAALRQIVGEELRRVLREERTGGRPANDGEYLPVAEAAARAAVTSATIRVWMAQGRLHRYYAGRELRVLGAELTTLMRRPPANARGEVESTPEEEAARYLEKRRRRAT